MATEKERRFVGPRRGQFLFAVAFFLVSALLLSQLGEQTTWSKGTKLASQPRFWPAIGLIAMVAFSGLYLARLPWRSVTRFDKGEAWKWLTALEFAVWFMAYVMLVPIIGYLPVTMAFAAALTWRMGYRSSRMIWISVAFGAVVVILFKGFLSVKIPGAALYEYLPGALRSFFILNF